MAIKLYRTVTSGHSHRVQLMLSLLGLEHELVDVNMRGGEHKSEAFLKMNAFGQVPVIDDNGTVLADSNAILVYLATKYDDGKWLPRDAVGAAQVQRWLSAAAGPLMFGPALLRARKLFNKDVHIERALARTKDLFGVMEKALSATPFLCGSSPTIADLSLYSYTAHAPEGEISLEPYPAIRAWLERIRALPGFVPLKGAS